MAIYLGNELESLLKKDSRRLHPDLSKLVDTEFREGTLVEYLIDKQLEIESCRGNVKRFVAERNRLIIVTDNPSVFIDYACFPSGVEVLKIEKGIFYLEFENLFIYALAPRGVEIPKTQTFDEYMKKQGIVKDEKPPEIPR